MEKRRLLDDYWDENARDDCLEMGNWNFATRTQKIEFDSSIDPDFGFIRGFNKPSDWLRTIQLASDEFFTSPLTEGSMVDEQSLWFSNLDTIYVRYVSNDDEYGYDLSVWPQAFVRYAEWRMALEIAPKLLQTPQAVKAVEDQADKHLTLAQSKDALNEGVKFPPETGWVLARRGSRGRGRRNDLGFRSSFTG